MKSAPALTTDASLDRIGQIGMIIARLIIGYMWITQLQWKLPPQFGCPPDFAVSTSLQARTTGLCDWTGLMAEYSKIPAHGEFVKNVIVPNLSWMGWGIWLMEAFIAVSLILGLLSRLGALLGFVQAVNLYIGLTAIPFEWYWTYGMLYTLHIIFFSVPPGRYWGIDTLLRPRLLAARTKGNRLAGLIYLFT
jgi:uncharacterized membrane protein YphA (DoxX/SURF4 family)